MSNYINENLLDASPYKKQKDEAKMLVGKWEKTGLLDGLNEEFQKSGMAVLLENQARQLIQENSSTGGGSGGANTAAAGSEEWSGVALPLVRRIFGEIAAQDFVSVQPMNLPSGLVFYLDFKYGKTTVGSQAEGFGTNSSIGVPGGDVKSLQGKSGPNSPSGSSTPYGVGGLYGEGRYDYSINKSITGELGIGTTTNGLITGSCTYKDVNFNQEFSSSVAAASGGPGLFKVTVGNENFSNADWKSVRSWNISGTAGSDLTLVHKLYPQFTDHYFTGEYPVKRIDQNENKVVSQLSLLSGKSTN